MMGPMTQIISIDCMRRLVLAAVFLFSGAVGVLPNAAADLRPQTSKTQPGKQPTVLFLCPHGAARSVLASAYFQRAAKERGLNVRVDAAGTDPTRRCHRLWRITCVRTAMRCR